MKILSEYTDLSIPEYALSYLVNGDTSGIDEQDKHIIDAYMQEFYNEAKEANGSLIFSTNSDESFFTWYPEFGNACMCEHCTILILVDDSQEEGHSIYD